MDLAELGPGAKQNRPPAIFDCKILDNATEVGQLVRCTVSGDSRIATDPMPWNPVTVTGRGTWFPKRSERAVVIEPADGPPVMWWQPDFDRPPDLPS